ncbi:GTPase Era [compost metagenome]
MMSSVKGALTDADLILFVTDINETHDENDVLEKIINTEIPLVVLLNKIDNSTQEQVDEKFAYWQEKLTPKHIYAISALHKYNLEGILPMILDYIPEHPAYYDKEELTDRSQRFFVSEIIREKIFFNYKKEIPYSTEVIVTAFKEEQSKNGPMVRITAEIVVERDSQKNILIGTGGTMLKKVGMEARKDIEKFLDQKVFLETFVKVIPDWRSKKNYLKSFGYD